MNEEKKEIEPSKAIHILKELKEYIESIDDRNSIKIQTMKSDMQKILKKVYIRDNGGLNGNNQM